MTVNSKLFLVKVLALQVILFFHFILSISHSHGHIQTQYSWYKIIFMYYTHISHTLNNVCFYIHLGIWQIYTSVIYMYKCIFILTWVLCLYNVYYNI